MTNKIVPSITDEQLAELEGLAEDYAFECCGSYDVGGEYMGQQERICCLEPHRTESEIKVMAEVILALITRLRAAEALLSECRPIVAREVERWRAASAILPVSADIESSLLRRIDTAMERQP